MDLIRRDTDYAMRALVYLAERQVQGPVSVKELAQTQDIPVTFAQKIMGKLARKGLVESRMGTTGGFVLKRHPEALTLLEIVETVQGTPALSKCLLGYDTCPRRRSCRISARLSDIQRALMDLLRGTTLADVAGRSCEGSSGSRGDTTTGAR